jgi:hypothetical protein
MTFLIVALYGLKGPEEPTRTGPSAPYIMGAEDFLYRREYAGGTLFHAVDRRQYHAGWATEELDCDDAVNRQLTRTVAVGRWANH